jgi:hypothetical protein
MHGHSPSLQADRTPGFAGGADARSMKAKAKTTAKTV